MALDGGYLSLIKKEIESLSIGSRIDKISQPSRDTLVLTLRRRGGTDKLLISAGAAGPRIHYTTHPPENPKSAPMFCMLLRKHLGSGRLVSVQQMGLDRILHLQFETVNELGDTVVLTLAVEIMGRHSNIIIIGPDGRIIDSIKRIDHEMSGVRPILPGMVYTLPPAQDKLNLLDAPAGALTQRLQQGRDLPLAKAILEAAEGLSPIVCRELAFTATKGADVLVSQLRADHFDRLERAVDELKTVLIENRPTPTALVEQGGKPLDFSFIPIHQYGQMATQKVYESCSALLDVFYEEKDRVERTRQHSGDLLKLLANTSERIARRLQTQRQELAQSVDRERLRRYGDLLGANLHTLKRGDSKALVQDFYSETGEMVEIPLDIMLTPAQNAQKYYTEYHKAVTAEKKLVELIAQGEAELEYIDSVLDALTRASSDAELTAIRAELAVQGYTRPQRGHSKKEERLAPLRYRSTDGFLILCGRNNIQNDLLTHKESRNYDIWFHTQKIPGSHTILVTEGREPSNLALEQAATIAAYNSRARHSAKVPVDYTQVRNVKKPPGAKPGMAIYDSFKTAIITPDPELVHSLEVK